MLDLIETHLLDLLQADPRLLLGGNAFAPNGVGQPAWSGALRPDNGDTAQHGYVNLYDAAYERSGVGHRPAIYLGDSALEATDRLDFSSCASQGKRAEYRILLLPLIVAVQVRGAGGKIAAKRQRNQLQHNLLLVLADHLLEPGYWYECTVPGLEGGGMATEHTWVSATGGASQGDAEAMASIPLQIRYRWSRDSQA